MHAFTLNSGGKPTALEGCDVLKKLTAAACGRIIIMAGAGVKSSNVADIIHETGVTECHASAKTCKCVKILGFCVSLSLKMKDCGGITCICT